MHGDAVLDTGGHGWDHRGLLPGHRSPDCE